MLRKVFYLSILPVALLVALTLLAGFVLVATEPGTRWLARELLPAAIKMLSGDRLRIQETEGVLLSSLTLTGLTYHPAAAPDNPTAIERISLDWRPLALFSGLLHVERFRLHGARLRLGAGEDDQGEPAQSAQPPQLPPLPALRIEDLAVTDLAVASGEDPIGEEKYHLQSLTARITSGGGADPILIRDLKILEGGLKLDLAAQIEPLPPFAYKLTGAGQFALPDGAPLLGEGELAGDVSKVSVERFSARALGGQMQIRGWAGWSGPPRWDLTLSARGIDPGAYGALFGPGIKENWNGALDLEAQLGGQFDGNGKGLGLLLKIGRIEGMLRGYPVAASGRLELAGKRIEARDLALRSGDNRLRLHGTAPIPRDLIPLPGADSAAGDPPLNLSFEIHAPALDALWPGLAGTLEGEGRLKGSLADPSIELQATGEGIAYQGSRIEALRVGLGLHLPPSGVSESGSPQSNHPESHVPHAHIEAKNVVLSGHGFSRLWVRGKGPMALEAIDLGMDFSCGPQGPEGDWRKPLCLEMQGSGMQGPGMPGRAAREPKGSLALELRGRWKEGNWSGRLQGARVEAPSLGQWTLTEPVPLTLGANAVRVGTADRGGLCLGQGAASLCLGGDWSKTSGFQVKGHLAGLPWSTFRPWLPDTLDMEGAIAARFGLRGAGDGKGLGADLTVSAQPGALVYRIPERGPLRTAFRDVRLSASYAPDGLRAHMGFRLGEQGVVEGKLQVGAPGAGYPLRGTARAEFPDLAPLAGLIPQVEEMEGALTLDFTAGGNFRAPTLRGRAALARGAVVLPGPGIRVQDISLVAEGQGKEPLKIRGQATSGPGNLKFTGSVRHPFGASPHLELTAEGKDFQVVRLPDVQVSVSPDLRVSWDRGGTLVEGKITVPEARLELEKLSGESRVAVSGDEIIVGEGADGESSGDESEGKVRARVSVVLGDGVSFGGYGLQAGLTGSIDLDARPGQPPLGDGVLTIKDGRYRAYGQKLNITRGRIIFSGPVDNPALDLRATRRVEVEDVTVGVGITGTPKRPLMALYSEPAMPEADVLAYLLTGKPLSNAPMDKQAALLDAAMGLTMSKSNSLAGRIGKELGLSTVKLQGGGGGLEQSSLLLGKYLTPQLYVGYVQGIFENTRTFEAEYQITDAMSIKARSGEERRSMEVIYSIEKD